MLRLTLPTDVIVIVGNAVGGRRRFGVPIRGPLDRESFESAIQAVGATQAFECHGYGGAEFVVEQECFVAVTGERRFTQIIKLDEGERLQLPLGTPGAVTYVASGTEQYDESLFGYQAENQEVRVREVDPSYCGRILNIELEVGMRSDRKGRLLRGLQVGAPGLEKSRPAVVGAVQLTPGGDVIVLGPDGPTIGGYAHVATVLQEDIPKLARAGIGHKITFKLVT